MGRIIQKNNGKTTIYVNGENFSSLSASTNTYYLGVDLLSGNFEKLNPNGLIINLEDNVSGFTGGTVTGETVFTNGLTANTFSATTYLNLPSNEFTGGTVTGETVFTNGLTGDSITSESFIGDGSRLGGIVALPYNYFGFTVTSSFPTTINQNITLPYNVDVEYAGPLTVDAGFTLTIPVGTTLTVL